MIIFLLSFFACDDHYFAQKHSPIDTAVGDGFAQVDAIISASCSGCHGGNFPPLDGDICEDVVGVASVQSSDMLLIEAGSAENSYLYHKLTNTHLEHGGSGGVMPMGGALSEAEIEILADWMDEGAACE